MADHPGADPQRDPEAWLRSLSPEHRAVAVAVHWLDAFTETLRKDWRSKLQSPRHAGSQLHGALGPVNAMAQRRVLPRTAISELYARMGTLIMVEEPELEDVVDGPDRGAWRDRPMFQEMPGLLSEARAELTEIKMALDRANPEPDAVESHPEDDDWVPIAAAAKRVPGTTADKIRKWTKRKTKPLEAKDIAGLAHVRLGDVRAEAAAKKKMPPRGRLSTTAHDGARRRRPNRPSDG